MNTETVMGRISSVQSMGTLDGEGVRFVVFFQGCPLRCFYCHNPETWEENGGEATTPQDLMKRIKRFQPYFAHGGGVTFSGGEPLCQPKFLKEMLNLCKESGIHTALDTSGAVFDTEIEAIYTLVDMVLLDLKADSEEAYQQLCGGNYETVRKTLWCLETLGKPTWIRRVIVPNYNENTIPTLANTLQGLKCVKKVELLPFRKLCLEKYTERGISFLGNAFSEASPKLVQKLEQQLRKRLELE